MSSPIERLAMELSEGIANHLSFGDLSRLMQTSKELDQRIEPFLYKSYEGRNEAMRWACTQGQLSIIRRTVSTYGASPSTVRIIVLDDELPPWRSPPEASTLHLAIRRGHLDAFKLLLELGARVDDKDVDLIQLKALLRRLFSPPKPAFIQAFFEAGCISQLPRHLIDRSLMMLINTNASLDLVERVLDSGANLNQAHACGSGRRPCPLSAAIQQNSQPLFNLLLKRGASIHGAEVEFPRRMPVHIPVYAAAYTMLKHGVAMLETCLEKGANINHRALMQKRCYRIYHYYSTPLLAYLDSIKSWPVSVDLDPVKNLEYLFDKGAVGDNLPHLALPTAPRGPIYYTEPVSSLELLLDNMHGRLEQLADPQFLAVAKLLIQHGTAKGHVGLLLTKYDHPHCSDALKQAWRCFVALLLEAPDRHEDLNTLLFNYIDTRGSSLDAMGDLTFETIATLVENGADINSTGSDGRPALHSLCWRYHALERFHSVDDSHFTVHHGHGKLTWHRRRLIAFLLAKGANPDLRVEGRTAEEILRDSMGSYPAEGKLFIEGLLEEIQKSREST